MQPDICKKFKRLRKIKKNIIHTDLFVSFFSRPEVSQCYILESNKFKANKKQIVYKSQGKLLSHDKRGRHPSVNTSQSESRLGSDSSQMAQFSGSVPTPVNAKRMWLSECVCYICKEKLGSDHSKRICKNHDSCQFFPPHIIFYVEKN